MFEDPELQDPLSLSLNESYNEQNSPHHDSKKAPASPEYNCETPEIEVIIKEEEEGWTVIENNESVRSDGEKEDASTGTCHHHFKASTVSQSSTRERLQAKMCMDSDDRPDISCMRGKMLGTVTLHQCNHTVCDIAPSLEKNMKSNQRIAVDDCAAQERSTALHPEAEPIETKLAAPYQTESFEHNPSNSHGLKQASASLQDQTLHLTVRLQAGEEEREGDQEEEIGGLINSDGEVVEWDARNSPDQSSDHTENTHPNKTRLHQRGSCSPTLIMEVVEDEEQVQEQGSKERATVSSSQRVLPGRRHRNKRKVPGVTVVSLETCDTEKQIPPNLVRRGRRKVLDAQLLPSDSLEEESGIPRRTRRQRKTPATVEAESKPVRPAAAKRSYRRRKDAKSSAEEQAENPVVSAGKKRPGRKMVHVPIEIPPELLKKPKEKIEYHCSVCGKEFPHAYKLERHELIHTGEKPYCCSICGRGFNQKGNLKTHYKVHFGGKGAVDFSDEVNSTQSDFSEYLKSLPGESKIRSSLHSFQCGKKCESQSDLQTHHITTHTEKDGEPDEVDHSSPQLFFCRRCGVQFGDKEKLEEHMKKHVKEKRYSCPDCGKRFINESYIQIHQRIHTGEKPFLCSQCNRGFHTASSLKLHEMQHSGERPFACSICGKTFRINSYLTAHYQTHVKDRPFVCSVCGKGYSRAEELKVHHRLHTGERPYECGQCGKSFIYRQGLRQHQRTHAGKRIGPTRQLGRPKQETRLDV